MAYICHLALTVHIQEIKNLKSQINKIQQVTATQQKTEMERLQNEMKVHSASMFIQLQFSLMTSLQPDVDA
jgi:ABC-type polysaccharide/polyol phosphate transport system ATPase subunit